MRIRGLFLANVKKQKQIEKKEEFIKKYRI